MSRLQRARAVFALPRENLLARFVTINVMGTAGSLVIGFVTSIVLARLLGPSGRGLLGLMVSVSQVALVLTAIGLPTAVTYFASLQDADPPAILGNCLAHAGVLSALLIPFAAIFHQQIADALGHGDGGRTWILVAAFVPVTFLDWTTNSQLQGTLRFARFNVVVVLARLVYAFGVVVLVGFVDLGVTGGMLAQIAGGLVMIVASLKPILDRGTPRVDRKLMSRMFHYGFRAQVGAVLALANGRLDVLIMQIYRPLAQVGYYVVAQAIAELPLVLSQQFRWTSMVLVTKYDQDAKQEATTADSVLHFSILGAVTVIANAVFGSLLILVAYGPEFHPAVVPMLILLPGIWFLGISIVIQGDLSGRGRPGLASWLAGLAAVVTVVLDFTLIPPFGVIGASIASVSAYTTLGVSSLVALSRISGLSIRKLVVPTRADLLLYWQVAGRLAARVRAAARRRGPGDGGDPSEDDGRAPDDDHIAPPE
jgi:O-antigen/teichoic acid export membrane protein